MPLLPFANAPRPATFYSNGTVKQQVYNVMDYGATGNGSTDDTTAIQAAITAAAVNGGVVFLPAGTYKTTAALVPASNIKIQGSGNLSIIAPSGTNFCAFKKIASFGSPTTNLEMCDFKIDGSGVTTSPYNPSNGKGIFLQYCLRLKIHGLYVYNTQTSGIGTDFLVDSQIDRCVVDTCGAAWTSGQVGGNGIGIGTGTYVVEDFIISDCIAKNCINNGIMIEDEFQATRSKGMIISNCTSYGSGMHGFLNSGTSGAIFSQCQSFSNQGAGIAILTGDIGTLSTAFNPQNCLIENCNLYNNDIGGGWSSIHIADIKATPDGTLLGIVVNDNFVGSNNGTTTPESGICFLSAQSCSINNNRIYANQYHGIQIISSNSGAPCNNFTIVGNTVTNNATGFNASGISISTSGSGTLSDFVIVANRCFDNQATKTQTYGLGLGGTLANFLVTGNDFAGNLTGAMSDASTSTELIVRDNLGIAELVAKSTAYTATSLDKTILVTGTTTITLPDATKCVNRVYTIKNVDASHTTTVATTSSQTIDGVTTVAMASQYEALTVQSDGSNWQVVNQVATSIL